MGSFDKSRGTPPEPEWIDVGRVDVKDSYARLRARADRIVVARGQRGSMITFINVVEPSPGFADDNPAQFQSHVLQSLASTLPMLTEKQRAAVRSQQLLFVHGRTGERQRTAAVVAVR
jgi:hypothetical protein